MVLCSIWHNSHFNLPLPENIFAFSGTFSCMLFLYAEGFFSRYDVSLEFQGCSNVIHTQNPFPNRIGSIKSKNKLVTSVSVYA